MGLHGWSTKLCVRVRAGLEVVYAHNCSYTPVCVCVCVCVGMFMWFMRTQICIMTWV